jgi:hypothetical protein
MPSIELWTPDIFFQTENIFREVSQPHVSMIARDFYNLSVSSIQQSGGFEVNSKNFLVDGVILKRLVGDYDVLCQQVDIYCYLHIRGIHTPEVIRNSNGAYITRHGNELWLAMEYIDGPFYRGTIPELALLIEALPLLFHFCAHYPKERTSLLPCRPMVQNPYIPGKDYAMFGQELQTIILASLPDIVSLSEQVCAYLPSIAHDIPMVHIDLHPRNILYKNDALYILDFDSFLCQPAPIAYNFAVYKLLRRCVADGINYRPFVESLFHESPIEKNALAAQAEILLRLLSTLELTATGDVSVWKALLPVHLRGLYESAILLGER